MHWEGSAPTACAAGCFFLYFYSFHMSLNVTKTYYNFQTSLITMNYLDMCSYSNGTAIIMNNKQEYMVTCLHPLNPAFSMLVPYVSVLTFLVLIMIINTNRTRQKDD